MRTAPRLGLFGALILAACSGSEEDRPWSPIGSAGSAFATGGFASIAAASGGTPGSAGVAGSSAAGGSGGSAAAAGAPAAGGDGTGFDAGDGDAPDPDGASSEAGDGSAPSPDGTGPEAGDGSASSDGGSVSVPPPEAGGCVTNVLAGTHHIDCDGLVYDLTVPERCVTKQCGLVVDVHGGTMSGPMEDKNTNMSALGQKYGYVVVTPTALFGLWNAATDDAKVLAFLGQVRDSFHIDPRRLHMTGLSQGGYMSWRFLCQHTDLFGSVAPAAAAGAAKISPEVGCTFTGTDVPQGEVDILYMHGTEDGLVDFPNAVVLRDAVMTFYDMGPGETVAGDSTYTRTRYRTKSGRVFEFIEHHYTSDSAVGIPPSLGIAIVGHCFPGSQDQTITLPGQLMAFGCKPPTSFTWGEEVMKFFIAHPKP